MVEVQANLLEQLHKASKGSIRLITVGLSRIESFARVQRWEKIDSQQWADRLQVCYGSNFEGNEDIYQLIQNTGAKAPFLCGEGSLYDLSTCCIYFTD